MVEQAVVDTNILEELNVDKLVVPKAVSDEAESRRLNDGIVDNVVSASVERESKCVNDNIEADIKKAFRRGGRNKSVKDNLVRAQEQRGESGRQRFLRQAWSSLPSDARPKSWQGEISGAETDCQVLKAGEDTGRVFTNDKSILDACKERDNIQCNSLNID